MTPENTLSLPVEELGLAVRTVVILRRAEIKTLSELIDKNEEEMTELRRNLGKRSFAEIKDQMSRILPDYPGWWNGESI